MASVVSCPESNRLHFCSVLCHLVNFLWALRFSSAPAPSLTRTPACPLSRRLTLLYSHTRPILIYREGGREEGREALRKVEGLA